MGRSKPLLPLQGETLLARSIRAVTAITVIDRTFVVLGAESAQLANIVEQSGAQVVNNPDWQEGLSTSVKAGLKAASAALNDLDSLLFCLADQPYVTTESLQSLLDARQVSTHPPKLVTARYDGHPGAPCWIDRSLFCRIAELAGDQGLRPLFRTLTAEEMAQVDLPELATDLDTPEDYQRVIAELG